jgi:acetyl esterase/lipase
MRTKIKVEITEPGLYLDSDVTYAQVPSWFGHTTENLKMSIIRHYENQPKPMPLLIWLCGGAWLQLDHNAHLPEFFEMAKHGFVIASVQYRLSNEAMFPAQLEDVKAAIRYLRKNAARYHIDPEHSGIMGESAGGHLSSMAGVTGETRQFDKGENLEQSSAVQAVCPFYGPVGFDEFEDNHAAGEEELVSAETLYLGGLPQKHPELAKAADPVTYISDSTPPFLLLHGNADTTVPFEQSVRLYDALTAKNIPADLVEVDGASHAALEFYQPQVKKLVEDFFRKHLMK